VFITNLSEPPKVASDNNTNYIGLEWIGSATDIIETSIVDITIVVTETEKSYNY